MNEGSFWRWLSKRLPPGDFTRIESPCSPGVPDVNYTLEPIPIKNWPGGTIVAVHGWIELKVGKAGRYPFKGPRRGFRPAQRLWLKRRLALGTICAIAAVIGPELLIWRLKATQIDGFSDLELDALRQLAAYRMKRRDVKQIPVNLLS